MPLIVPPEFGSAQTNENEPTAALKASGWADGDKPPASVMNWISRATYDSIRSMLGLHLAALVDKFAIGPVANTSTAYDIQAIGIDAGGHVLIASYSSPNSEIFRSTDNGASYAQVNNDGAGAPVDLIAISDGVYAVAAYSGGSNGYYYASYPYTSWSEVGHAWGGNVVDWLVADIGDGHGPSVLVLTDAGSIWVADATSAPTVTGDWTEYDISSVIAAPTSFALDVANGILVVAGANGTPDGVTAWCDVADGVAAGDFSTPVNHGSTSVDTIAHNGERFVIVVMPAEDMLWSVDGETWTAVVNATAMISASNQVLQADPDSGFFFLFDGETTSAACNVAVSRDGIFWVLVTTSAQNVYINGTRGAAPKLHPIVHRWIGISYNADGNTQRIPMQTL